MAPAYMPEELILDILECACASIIQDLTTTPSLVPFSIPVNHFLQLRLVCKCFNRILTDCIRVTKPLSWVSDSDSDCISVNGVPIEQWLRNKQIWNWFHLKDGDTIENIRRVCGSVWYNPRFFPSFECLFCTAGTSEDVRVWLMYRAPEVFTEHLIENEEYCRPKRGEQSIQPRRLSFEDEKGEFQIEFVPGRYQFEQCFHCVPYQGYFGTSMMSFKPPRGVTVGGTGPFWLWYRSMFKSVPGELARTVYQYMVVDYGAKRAVNSASNGWEFGENTVMRMPSEKLQLQD
jgi:hypothetical protein